MSVKLLIHQLREAARNEPVASKNKELLSLAAEALSIQPPETHSIVTRSNLIKTMRDLTSDEKCRYDHNGFCQVHYYDDPCPHDVAKAYLGMIDMESRLTDPPPVPDDNEDSLGSDCDHTVRDPFPIEGDHTQFGE